MRHDIILRVGVKLIIPFILLFAIYVHLHGEYGPGGAFQGGVVIAAAIILYGLIFGLEATKRVVPSGVIDFLVPLGVAIYAAGGLPGLLFGRGYLDYGVYGADPLHAHEWGVFIIELGVLITVSATMIAIFYAFAGRGRT